MKQLKKHRVFEQNKSHVETATVEEVQLCKTVVFEGSRCNDTVYCLYYILNLLDTVCVLHHGSFHGFVRK